MSYPTKARTKVKGRVSYTRVFIAVCTFGLSLPFLGFRTRDWSSTTFR